MTGDKVTILNVDDNPVARAASTMVLKRAGFNVLEAEDGQGALELVQDQPDLILLDVELPDIDGFEVCRRVRRDRSTAGIPVLHLSASVKSDADKIRGLDGGAEGYLTSPVNPDVLVAYIRALLRTREAEARLKRAHDDHLSILNRLRSGIVTVDGEGTLTFLNRSALALVDGDGDPLGSPWQDALPLAANDLEQLSALMESGEGDRMQVLVARPDGRRRCLELVVQDDPRMPEQRMLLIYDKSEVHDLRQLLDSKATFQDMVGRSAPMQDVFKRIQAVATVDWTALIEGDTGTGKELVARAIHSLSARKDRPFIAVNCAGLSDSLLSSQLFGHKRGAFTGAVKDQEGLFEAADGGTLFLDEIGDISQNMQRSLLRVMEEREVTRLGETLPRKVDARVLCATHRDLASAVEQGDFRQDLLYRIRVARISLPPLRRRREDIPLLVAIFLQTSQAATGKSGMNVSAEAMNVLMRYRWPGNVRELRAAIDFATLHSVATAILPEDLPPEIVPDLQPPPPSSTDEVPVWSPEVEEPMVDERQRIIDAVKEAKGKRSAAARLLGMSRATFYRRLNELDITLD